MLDTRHFTNIDHTMLMQKIPCPVGARFGKLQVIDSTEILSPRPKVLCRCDCGKELAVRRDHLISGNSQSCGCSLLRHGHASKGSVTRTWNSWYNMRSRCTYSNHPQWGDYGGRGIKVCSRWMKFENFLEDMGECPDGLTIERLDNDRGYEPGNCAWKTRTVQGRNKRNNRRFTILGTSGCLSELCEHFHISPKVVDCRLRYGWTPEKAFTAPLRVRRSILS